MNRTFNIGDRVKLEPPQPAATAQTFGQVVYYYGKHNPRHPRVRWASGWGTTCSASRMTLMTADECRQQPPVELVEYDLPLTP